MASERYSFSLTTFSPSGKLVQIEYALQAVASGAPSVGIKVGAEQIFLSKIEIYISHFVRLLTALFWPLRRRTNPFCSRTTPPTR